MSDRQEQPKTAGAGGDSAGEGSASKVQDAKAARLAAALRQNLQRRKAQTRGRKQPADAPDKHDPAEPNS